jgi:hypothetical protein
MKLYRLVLEPLEEDRVRRLVEQTTIWHRRKGDPYRSEGSSISRIYVAKKRIRMGGGEAFPLI